MTNRPDFVIRDDAQRVADEWAAERRRRNMGANMHRPDDVKFTRDDAQRAADEWGANCGPGAIAAVLGKTLDELRPDLVNFEKKHYVNPKMMFRILRNLEVDYRRKDMGWPARGLMRVQWTGSWAVSTAPRHSHWVAVWAEAPDNVWIFDINCICVGGWVRFEEWRDKVVPWLLKQVEPKAFGHWYPTHILEVI